MGGGGENFDVPLNFLNLVWFISSVVALHQQSYHKNYLGINKLNIFKSGDKFKSIFVDQREKSVWKVN